MRVQTRPQVQVSRTVAKLDTVDLAALQLARDWGIENGHKEQGWTFSPCPRPDCGGAIVSGWTDGACILCARSGKAPIAPGRPRRHDYGPRNASGSL